MGDDRVGAAVLRLEEREPAAGREADQPDAPGSAGARRVDAVAYRAEGEPDVELGGEARGEAVVRVARPS